MANFPEMRDDVFQTVLQVSRQDPDAQVKTSAVVVLADWIQAFPEKTAMLIDQLSQIFKTAGDEDVRALSYQLFALHKDKLPPDLQAALFERLKIEPDSFSRSC
jgi:hypothetical protein